MNEERHLKEFLHEFLKAERMKVTQIMKMRLEGRMKRGRPRIKWEDTPERIGQQRGKLVTVMKRLVEIGEN